MPGDKRRKVILMAVYHRRGKKFDRDKAKDGHGMKWDRFTVWTPEQPTEEQTGKEACNTLLEQLVRQGYKVTKIESGECHA